MNNENSNFKIELNYGLFDGELLWEGHIQGTNVYVYGDDLPETFDKLNDKINGSYPLKVTQKYVVDLDEIFSDKISAFEELEIIRQAAKESYA